MAKHDLTQESPRDTYPYLSVDVTRNTRGHTISVTARSRPGESDEDTLLRLRSAYAELASLYPPDQK